MQFSVAYLLLAAVLIAVLFPAEPMAWTPALSCAC
jgi:hypothetical protein